jgi:hypothetical protein
VWPVKTKSSNKEKSMKVCGRNEKIDGYWCFVETARGKKIVHEKIPIEQHLREVAEAKKRLRDLVTMNCKDFVKCYSR